jgi:UDP-N-acetyl-2-amino-2-deoxyglucuronate dehydrogenase
MMYKTSIVGCGAIAQVHAENIHNHSDITLISAADIVPEKVKKLTDNYGGKAFASIDELLADQKPDVIHICTPHNTHVELARKALQSGVNVLLEKPPFIRAEDMQPLNEAIEKSGKTFGICFQNRYKETVLTAKSLLDSKKAGKILGARGFVTWKRNEVYYTGSSWRGKWATEGGGVLINQAIHTLDQMLWLVGDPVSVEGTTSNHHLSGVIEVEDTAEMYFDFGDNVHGIFYATTSNCCDSAVYLEIDCENYKIILEGQTLSVQTYDGQVRQFCSNPPVKVTGKECWGNGHTMLIEDYYSCIGSDRKFPIGLVEGSRAIRALLCFYQAAATKKTVACH